MPLLKTSPTKERFELLERYMKHHRKEANDKEHHRKRNNHHVVVPSYLKEDLPNRTLHAARLRVRKMNEGMPPSPTAQEYTTFLD